MRSGINEIRDTQKQQKEVENKYLDDNASDRSVSPSSGTLLSQNDRERSQSLSPPPENIVTENVPLNRSGTLELMKSAPHHLRKKSDEQVLQEFFGSDQLDKLHQFKSNLDPSDVEGEGGQQTGGCGSRGGGSHGSPHSLSSHNSSPLINHALNEVKLRRKNGSSFKEFPEEAKLRMPINLNPGTDRLRASYDVASEMEKLRLRLQENTLNELAELDKKYSPKFSHPGFRREEETGANHSRQGSLDSSIPPVQPTAVQSHGHIRQYSLPVNIDPATFNVARMGESTQTRSTHSGSMDHVRGHRDSSRSPTPPFQYGHIRQVSGGSASSGSGTFSPPPTVTSPHHESPLLGHIVAPTRSGRRSRPSSGVHSDSSDRTSPSNAGQSGTGVGSMTRGSHNHGTSQTGNGSVPSYSTYVVKKKRNSLERIENGKHQIVRNGYPPSNPSHQVPAPSLRLQPPQTGYNKFQNHSVTDGLDQPEQKSLPWNPFSKMVSDKVSASPRMSRATSSGRRDTLPEKPHTYLIPRRSEPSIYPEDIQPYMSTAEVKAQMPFEYVPFAAQSKRGGDTSSAMPLRTVGRKTDSNRQNQPMPENTWC